MKLLSDTLSFIFALIVLWAYLPDKAAALRVLVGFLFLNMLFSEIAALIQVFSEDKQ